MKGLKVGLGIVMAMFFVVGLLQGISWAVDVSAGVTANITSVGTISLTKEPANSACATPTTILFDKVDSVDMTDGTGSPGLMYAPYRSKTNMNWHVVSIAANGSTTKLAVTVTGNIGTTPLANVLSLICGGFYETGAGTPIPNTASPGTPPAWETASGWARTLNRPFIGTVPFNYQINISALPSGNTTIAGGVKFTLTTT